MRVAEADLKAFIIDSGLVPRSEVDEAAAIAQESGQSLGETLVSRGSITEDALRRLQAYTLGIPFVNLKEHRIPLEVLALIPEPISRTHSIVAYKKEGGILEVAMLDIEDLPSVDAVRAKTGLKIVPRLADTESIKHALLAYQQSLKKDFGDIISAATGKLKSIVTTDAEPTSAELKAMAEDLSIVRIVDTLLRHAIAQDATDIHIEPMKEQVLVRYRIGGALHDAMTLPREAAHGILARIKDLANLNLEERHVPQDGRLKMETGADEVSLRVSTLPTAVGEKVVLRLLRQTGEGFTLDSLGFHGASLERVHRALRERSGFILVAGPAGSGKTTTLYTLLDILNKPSANISTVEDKVDYRMKRVHQVQANTASGLSRVAALRAALRQDSDVVMIGNLADADTTALAVSAALSGRLVLAGIEAGSAAEALARLADLGIDPLEIASSVHLVIGQRLARRLCAEKDSYRTTRADRGAVADEKSFTTVLAALREEKLAGDTALLDLVTFYRAKPSTECYDGYRGHIGLQEVLAVSNATRELLRTEGTSAAIEKQAKREGMLTLLEDGIYKAMRGMTSLEEVVRATRE